jgi:NAD(P)-dependent dehydrogenase (short-subunit alcohol dehydrogenase family)
MPSVFITGANRGLGLEFARQYQAAGWRVYATCRTPADADPLRALAEGAAGQLTVHALDTRDQEAARALARTLAGHPIDVLLNNAAIWGPRQQTLEHIDYRVWAEVLDIDLMGPLRVTDAFLGHVAASERKTLVMLSSRVASIASYDLGGRYFYRSAKAGLNALVKSLAIDLAPRGVVCIALSPGWVRTEMGGPDAPLTVTESVTGMRQVIDRLDPGKTGGFLHYDGSVMPW